MTHESRRHAALATLTGTGATVAITVAQAFLLIPLCLSQLGRHLYGAWLGATEWLVWIQLLDLGVPNLLTQRVGAAIGRGDRHVAAQWSSTGLALLAITGLVLGIVGVSAGPGVSRWAQVPPESTAAFTASFRLGVGASVALLFSNGLVGLSRGVQRTTLVNAAQVAAALAGLVVSIVLLMRGWGVLALALGLLVRAVICLVGGAVFLVGLPSAGTSWWTKPSTILAREIAHLVPSMGSASLGYVLANNSEILLVTTLFGPVPAAIYGLTRRAMDGLRNLLDSIAWAVYGGFAHLVTADDRHRSRLVLHEILWARLALACLAAGVALAVNRTFVTLLFGAEQFGGLWLTVAFAAQMVLTGQSFLANFLLRSAGQVREGSWLLTAEAALRVVSMFGGLLIVGLAGAPLAAALVSLLAVTILRRRLDVALPAAVAGTATRGRSPWAAIGVAAIGVLVAALKLPISWTAAVLTVAGVGTTGALVLWLNLRTTAAGLFQWRRL